MPDGNHDHGLTLAIGTEPGRCRMPSARRSVTVDEAFAIGLKYL